MFIWIEERQEEWKQPEEASVSTFKTFTEFITHDIIETEELKKLQNFYKV